MRKTTRRFFSYLLMGLVILSIGTPGNFGAAFGDSIDLEALGGGHGDHGDWDKSSLSFIGQDGNCDLISATVMNGSGSRDMKGTTRWELYWIESGNPKGTDPIAWGTVKALESGESDTITYNPALNANGPDGVYMFKVYQRPDHPGTGVLWSESITLKGCVLEPETGSLTVNKTFSDQNEDEVTVVLYEVTESGDVQVASQETVGHTTTFTGLDLEKEYKISEVPVPTGYEATYPDGQGVEFNKDNLDTLRILNTLIPVDPEKGSLNVTKSYSNGNATEVTVELYKVTGEGDVLVATQVTSGLATTFSNLDIESTYKIVEAPVPAGYSVSYPNGQTKVISGTEPEALSIRNTLTVVDPEKGSLNVTKSYSNGNTTEVTVELYKVTGEGDVLVATQVTSSLATTFSNLDIESTYKIVEAPVPTGYTVSYPGGQTKAISGMEAEALSILNTLVPVDNPGGGGTPTTPGTPTVTTTTTIDRDRADPPVQTIPAEPTPLAAPVIVPEVPTPIPDEIIPLGVPMLPKTGEVPVEVFYGLGGMLTAVGAFLKRK